MAAHVDDLGLFEVGPRGKARPRLGMTMDKEARLIANKEREKRREPLVGGIGVVVDSPRGGVGKENVEPPSTAVASPQPPGELPHPTTHSRLRVLVIPSPPVAGTPPQPSDDEPPHLDNAALHARSPLWGNDLPPLSLQGSIVIAVYVQERNIERIHEVAEVVVGKVAAGEDEPDIGKPFPGQRPLEGGVDLIPHEEELCHVPTRSSSPSSRSRWGVGPLRSQPRAR